MRSAVALAFVVVTVAPAIGIWRGHAWAKAKGMALRTAVPSAGQDSQPA